MGAKSSRQASQVPAENGDGQATLRAIAKGRVYVVIGYPKEVERLDKNHFNEEGYDALLGSLQEVGRVVLTVL